LNRLLANFLEAEPQADRGCFFCGGQPVIEGVTTTGKVVFLCRGHKHVRGDLKTWRDLNEK
jgi:hypothetical protein